MNALTRLTHLAIAMCRKCGLDGAAVLDVAGRIINRALHRPRGQQFACLVSSLREELRRELGLPGRALPRDWVALQAVGQYEAGRREYASMRGGRWVPAFDRHSRRFAIENGVCPRCAARGRFTEGGGVCKCGFSYG